MNSFVQAEDDMEKTWKSRLLAHPVELLITLCLVLVVTLVLGIGLGGEELSVI